jgi:hypothetical protein
MTLFHVKASILQYKSSNSSLNHKKNRLKKIEIAGKAIGDISGLS